MNIEKFRQELESDHFGYLVDEAKVRLVAEHMRQRIMVTNQVRARAIATWCFYESIKSVVLNHWDFNVATTIRPDWEKAARLMEQSRFARTEPKAAKRAAAMLRTGKEP